MKKVMLFLAVTLIAAFSFNTPLQAQIETFPWQNTQRQFAVRTPSTIDRPLPIVFFLHGLGDNISNIDSQLDLTALASYYKWIIVIPQALSQAGLGTMWNAGLLPNSTDDSGFLMALLDSLENRYLIDQDSVFFTGFSMGGFMTHRMAIEHSDRINACAPVSGLITTSLASQTPASTVRMLHVHGTNDNVVGYNGFSQYFNMTLGIGVDSIVSYWKAVNDCNDDVTIDSLPDLKNDGLRFVSFKYNCASQLELLKVIGGQHDWYSSYYNDIGYLEYIHDFFVGATDGITTTVSDSNADLDVSPNPTSGLANITVDKDSTIEVLDMNGRTVDRHKLTAGTNIIDLGSLPNGVYLIKSDEGSCAKIMLSK